MSKTTVTNYLLGGTNKGRHPATQGSEWSCNMFMEESGGVKYLASLPGLKYYKQIGSGRCRGSYVSSIGKDGVYEDCFVVFGQAVYRIDYSENVERIGFVANGTGRVSFAETGGLRPYLLIADGSNLWAYDLINGGSLTQCTLPTRYGTVGEMIKPTHVATVGGSVVVNDSGSGYLYYTIPYPLQYAQRSVYKIINGEVQYTDSSRLVVDKMTVSAESYMFLDDYGASQFFNTTTSSDAVQAIVAIGSSLYLFGTKTVEIYQRGNGEYETWVRTSYTTNASNGIQCPYSIAVVGSTLYYLGSGESFAKGIMRVDGANYTKISDDWLEEKLLQEQSDTVYSFAYAVGSHNFYVLHLPTLGETWCYDSDTQQWHQRVSRDKVTGLEIQWRCAAMSWYRGKFLAFCHDGACYLHTDTYYYEDYTDEKSIPMTRHRQGAVVVNENAPFIFNELAIECNVGTWCDYNLAPKMLLEGTVSASTTWV